MAKLSRLLLAPLLGALMGTASHDRP
jgi:hypothetical protein